MKVLRDDEEATAILRDLVKEPDLDGVAAGIDRLSERVASLTGSGGEASAAVAAVLRSTAPVPRSLAGTGVSDTAVPRPSRTFLRL